MWFRRKKKTDPDSALTETLSALQTLLEDEDSETGENREEPKMGPTPERFDPPMEQSDSTSIPTLHRDTAIPGKVKPRAPGTDTPTDQNGADGVTHPDPEPTHAQIEQPDTLQEATAMKPGGPFDIDIDDDLFKDPRLHIQGYPNPDADRPPGEQRNSLDSIPVLHNVVHMPTRNALNDAVGTGPELHDGAYRTTGLPDVEIAVVQIVIDECVRYLSQRLEQRRLAPLSEEQEENLREALAAMLETEGTAGSE